MHPSKGRFAMFHVKVSFSDDRLLFQSIRKRSISCCQEGAQKRFQVKGNRVQQHKTHLSDLIWQEKIKGLKKL